MRLQYFSGLGDSDTDAFVSSWILDEHLILLNSGHNWSDDDYAIATNQAHTFKIASPLSVGVVQQPNQSSDDDQNLYEDPEYNSAGFVDKMTLEAHFMIAFPCAEP